MTGCAQMAVLAGLVLAADRPAENAVKREREKLTGTWSVVSVEANGQTAPAEATRDFRFIFTADRVTRKRGGKVESETGYRLDPSKTPRWIDLTGKEGGKDHAVPAVYSLEGDTLKLCFRTDYKKKTKAGEPLVRPTRLDGGRGSEQVVMTLRRDKR
jgi:uncharacterized protein (TIGR03067 family)